MLYTNDRNVYSAKRYKNKNFAAVTPRTIKFPCCLQCNCSTLLYPREVFGAHDNCFHYITIRRAELENSARIWGVAVDLYVVWL